MKKLLSIIALIAAITVACDNANSTKEHSSEDTIATEDASTAIEGFEVVSLEDYDLNFDIQLPEGGQAISIQTSPSGDVLFNDGKHFSFSITPFGFSLEELKAELDNDLVYSINYVEEGTDYIIFEKTIADSDVEKEMHFIMVKEKEGELYEIKSSTDQVFKKHHIDKMIQSAKSLI